MEVNFDGIVGLTHNYSGLSYGNVASVKHQKQPSNPKQAALQGLEKMKYLMDLGIKQAVLPPQERPHIPTLHALGFQGSDREVIHSAFEQSPEIFFSCSSASCMWAANAATMSPSSDSTDKLVHFTPANLSSKFHRSIEPEITAAVLKKIFPDPKHFIHHPILPPGTTFTDEGAANHTRFCSKANGPGVQLFVFGKRAFGQTESVSKKFPARQSYEASQTITRLHQINPGQVIFAQQNPQAIDAGVFHNDVISVGHQNVFLFHEDAFVNTDAVITELEQKIASTCNAELIKIKVTAKEVSLSDAVNSYLFNSQIVTLPNNTMQLITPSECLEVPSVKAFLDQLMLRKDHPIKSVHYFNLRESMFNGGGPACLRFRVVLNDKEIAATHPYIFLTPELYIKLQSWINRHYRDYLLPQDLADPSLLEEGRRALDELTTILHLGSLYSFQ